MIEKIPQSIKEKLHAARGHIFYSYNDLEKYIDNAVTFIVAGIEQGDLVLFVENSKLFPVIKQKLASCLTSEQLTNLQYQNNFDFYFSKGTFSPAAVFQNFADSTDTHFEQGRFVRTWGHVEWSDLKDVRREIEIYEKQLNQVIPLRNMTSVCAYNADRVDKLLFSALLACHGYAMTDFEIKPI